MAQLEAENKRLSEQLALKVMSHTYPGYARPPPSHTHTMFAPRAIIIIIPRAIGPEGSVQTSEITFNLSE